MVHTRVQSAHVPDHTVGIVVGVKRGYVRLVKRGDEFSTGSRVAHSRSKSASRSRNSSAYDPASRYDISRLRRRKAALRMESAHVLGGTVSPIGDRGNRSPSGEEGFV